MSLLPDLPSEIYLAILSFVPPHDLQKTVLSLSRVLPNSPVPVYLLYQNIRLKHARQVVQLYTRLRATDARPFVDCIKEFSLECWNADAEVVLNLLCLIPRLEALSIWIGANNFSPEHLEELFTDPIEGLGYLSLRFKPYLKQANYYQFLKGAYFDSTLRALSRWPAGSIPVLSITQDTPDALPNDKKFAQPIVFFQLDPYLSVMLHSPALSHSISSLRLRLPSRPVTRSLCNPPPPHAAENMEVKYIPPLKFLDLSTCGVLETELDTLLVRFKDLQHLILDGCTVRGGGELREGEWGALGKRCAMIGTARARAREKALKAYLEAQAVAAAQFQLLPVQVEEAAPRPSRTRRGRRGVATATISLRERAEPEPVTRMSGLPKGAVQKIRVLPPLPSLVTLCMTTSIKADKYPALREEFAMGWAEGVGLLRITRARFRTSAGNGVRVVKFVEGNHEISEQGFDGLVDVDGKDEGMFDVPDGEEGVGGIPPPVLCFVGGKREADHVAGCGHGIGWDIWKDDPVLE